MVEIDGANHVVEFQWQTPEGTETSGVNDPAVSGTRIEDVRAALAAELGTSRSGENSMNLVTTLAAILGCAATDVEVTRAAEKQSRDLAEAKRGQLAAEQERDGFKAEVETAKKTAAAAVAKSLATEVNALIEAAYKGGKLRYGRDEEGKAIPSKKEARLRRIAKEDGIAGLKVELEEMDAIVPIAKRTLDDGDPVREFDAGEFGSELDKVAAELGLDPKDVQAEYANMIGEG
jgi:hypothetical protein